MKYSELAAPSLELLHEHGFKAMKPHSFGRIVCGIFQHISFQAQGGDMYLWYNVLPISLPDLPANAGWNNAAGRSPQERVSLDSPGLELRFRLVNDILPRLDTLSSLSILAEAFTTSNVFANYPRAFCLLQLEHYEAAMAALIEFLADPIDRSEKIIAQQYLSAPVGRIKTMLSESSTANIKRLKLHVRAS